MREHISFMLLMAAYALQSVLIGIRWGYDVRAIMPILSVLATLIAPLAWIAFSGPTKERSEHRLARLWPHLLPACLVALLLIFWREPVGPAIILVFLSYGLALLWLALAGPDVLVDPRLDGVLRSYRSLWVTALAILASPITDIIISFDMQWTGGVIPARSLPAATCWRCCCSAALPRSPAKPPLRTKTRKTKKRMLGCRPRHGQPAKIPRSRRRSTR